MIILKKQVFITPQEAEENSRYITYTDCKHYYEKYTTLMEYYSQFGIKPYKEEDGIITLDKDDTNLIFKMGNSEYYLFRIGDYNAYMPDKITKFLGIYSDTGYTHDLSREEMEELEFMGNVSNRVEKHANIDIITCKLDTYNKLVLITTTFIVDGKEYKIQVYTFNQSKSELINEAIDSCNWHNVRGAVLDTKKPNFIKNSFITVNGIDIPHIYNENDIIQKVKIDNVDIDTFKNKIKEFNIH